MTILYFIIWILLLSLVAIKLGVVYVFGYVLISLFYIGYSDDIKFWFEGMLEMIKLRKSAEGGNTHDAVKLGFNYFHGIYTKKNNKKALYWYTSAATSGDTEAQLALGRLKNPGNEMFGNDYNKTAISWLKKASSAGMPEATHELGNYYYLGIAVEKDRKAAFKNYLDAATKGYGMSQKFIGDYYYYDSDIVDKNITIAREWYKKAAFDHHSYNELAIIALAKIKSECSNNEDRLKENDEELLSNPFDCNLYFMRSFIELRLKMFKEAFDSLKMAIKLSKLDTQLNDEYIKRIIEMKLGYTNHTDLYISYIPFFQPLSQKCKD